VIHSLTANIGQFKHCNSLVHFFLKGANIFTLDSNELYFCSRKFTLPQDSHSLQRSTRDLWTVPVARTVTKTKMATFTNAEYADIRFVYDLHPWRDSVSSLREYQCRYLYLRQRCDVQSEKQDSNASARAGR
jgi:hypothetical protein